MCISGLNKIQINVFGKCESIPESLLNKKHLSTPPNSLTISKKSLSSKLNGKWATQSKFSFGYTDTVTSVPKSFFPFNDSQISSAFSPSTSVTMAAKENMLEIYY